MSIGSGSSSSAYQLSSFIKNSSVYYKQKRVAHIASIEAHNLQIANSNRFFVWLTLHQPHDGSSGSSSSSRAFFLSDRKENERNPKWRLNNLNSIRLKEFLLRIWYTNLDDNVVSNTAATTTTTRDGRRGMHLLMNLLVRLDELSQVGDEQMEGSAVGAGEESAYHRAVKSIPNLVLFHICGVDFYIPSFNSLVISSKTITYNVKKEAKSVNLKQCDLEKN